MSAKSRDAPVETDDVVLPDEDAFMKEAYYWHTIQGFVLLMQEYGRDKVLADFKEAAAAIAAEQKQGPQIEVVSSL